MLKQFDDVQKERYEIFRKTKIEASNDFNKIKEVKSVFFRLKTISLPLMYSLVSQLVNLQGLS